jgi:hypothetical protein
VLHTWLVAVLEPDAKPVDSLASFAHSCQYQVERFSAAQPVRREIGPVDCHHFSCIASVGEPDQRCVRKINIPIGVTFDHGNELIEVVGGNRLNEQAATLDPRQERDFAPGIQEMADFGDDSKRRYQTRRIAGDEFLDTPMVCIVPPK